MLPGRLNKGMFIPVYTTQSHTGHCRYAHTRHEVAGGMNHETTQEKAGDLRAVPSTSHPNDMVWIPGGTFLMGSDSFYPEERPIHRVTVDGFWMDEHPVTNEAFRRFVE